MTLTKKRMILFIIVLVSFIFTFKGMIPNQMPTTNYTEDYLASLKEKAVLYEDSAYHAEEIPMRTLIKATGVITKTDGKNSPSIQKADRFVLELADGQTRLHIINQSTTDFSLHNTVTIYGEYNGIIKADLVEISMP
ncbi:hypothetical protein ACFQOY_06335 [Enterococcus alcedinis]|uniref:Uncharacterized protein n=1 Tax=Enterococcus alcedinis TaxID=1274384 RepID=A0A917N603_9ENTE|nr:hypothetical protein [Enterococcus alcedinis]MBP2101708.1 hypothetical protein [Enterococcus alcedinis]GGI65272.1 hypothetical protein GCM10011482_09260 [Enterococcus alcedinis]